MFIGPRRAVLIGAIVAVAATIILLPLIYTLNAPDFSKVKVRLANVTILDPSSQSMQIRAGFKIMNPTDQTITTSKIDYELFADGVSLGTHILSYEDTPLNGRPAIFSKTDVSVPDSFLLKFDDTNSNIYNKIKENPQAIKWHASGTAEIESTLTIATRSFNNDI